MPVLTIRKLPEVVHERLRVRAARGRRSMEAEARAILADAVGVGEDAALGVSLQDWVRSLYDQRPPTDVVGEFVRDRRREAERE